MPKHLAINGAGFKGINSDSAPWDLPKEFITSGRNFRAQNGRIESVGSVESFFTPAANYFGAHLVPVNTPSADYWMILGRSAIKVYDGSTETDISSVAGYSGISPLGELLWNSCLLGRIPIVNNPQHVPEYWSPQITTQVMQPLQWDASNTWAASNKSCQVMRAHKNYLFAIYMTESGTDYPNVYRWSHPADINGLPPSWDETDVNYIAGRAQVGGETGILLDGRSLRDSFCLYAETGVYILDESNDEFVWRQRQLSESFGLISVNAISEVKGVHFFLSDGDIIRNDGNKMDSAIYGRLRKRLQSNASGDYYDRSFVARDTVKKELWFCVPEAGAQFPNIAYVYNWKEDNWTIHSLPYAESGAGAVTAGISHAAYGLQPSPPLTYADAGVAGETYDKTTLIYASQSASPLNSTVVGVDPIDSELVLLDPSNVVVGVDTDFMIERTDLPIGGQHEVNTITRIYPFVCCPDPIQIQVGSQAHASAPVNWEAPVTFNPQTDRKLDFRSTGPLHAWRIESIGDGRVSMTGMNIEFETDGVR